MSILIFKDFQLDWTVNGGSILNSGCMYSYLWTSPKIYKDKEFHRFTTCKFNPTDIQYFSVPSSMWTVNTVFSMLQAHWPSTDLIWKLDRGSNNDSRMKLNSLLQSGQSAYPSRLNQLSQSNSIVGLNSLVHCMYAQSVTQSNLLIMGEDIIPYKVMFP